MVELREGVEGTCADGACSIREFCELDTPIFMFDKDGMFVVMRLEQVRFLYAMILLDYRLIQGAVITIVIWS